MAGFQPVPNTVQAQMQYSVGGQNCLSSVYYRLPTPADQTKCQQIAQAVTTLYWLAQLQPLVTPDFFMSSIVATALDSQQAPTAGVDMIAGQQNGTAQGMSIPSGSTLVGSLVTAERSRNGRGRIYISGIPAGQLSDPINVTNGYITNFITALQAFLEVAVAVSGTLVVVSRFLNKVQRPQGVPITVTQLTADKYIDSQRRRLGGRGT